MLSMYRSLGLWASQFCSKEGLPLLPQISQGTVKVGMASPLAADGVSCIPAPRPEYGLRSPQLGVGAGCRLSGGGRQGDRGERHRGDEDWALGRLWYGGEGPDGIRVTSLQGTLGCS